MSKRSEHAFQFTAQQIADAAKEEAEYHESRVLHWTDRRDKALAIVKETIGAKVVETPVTGGVQAQVIAEYGDPEAWGEYTLANQKVFGHQRDAERFRTDEKVYASQSSALYELDGDDVQHFRLGGQPRPE